MIKTCNCEDFPCCGHGEDERFASEPMSEDFGPAGDDMNEFADDEGENEAPDRDVDDSMDGDHESALASAGFGTDEDYGGGAHDWESDGGFED